MKINKLIILGSTGMLGQALMKSARQQAIKTIGVARSGADMNLDVLNFHDLENLIHLKKPNVVINCIANSDINSCESNFKAASLINSHFVSNLVDICQRYDIYLIHISTDHFYDGNGLQKHDEQYPISLVNNYAKTKYSGEKFVSKYANSLVIRTNIVGFRHNKIPTFIEWALSSLKYQDDIMLFDDFYTSSIDVYLFSEILFNLINTKKPLTHGLINIASSDISSKNQFIKKLAQQFNYPTTNCQTGSITSLNGVKRATSLGLDVSKIETVLGRKMPTINQVISSLYKNREHHDKNQ